MKLSGSRHQLSPAEQETLKRVLEEKYEYIDNEQFHQDDAETRLFEEAPEIKRPDTSWYHPVMENLSVATRSGKGPGAVLLTAAEERTLFLQFNYCRFRVVKVKEQVSRDGITAAQARELLEWHRRAEELRDQIAQTNLALVLAMAKRTRMSEVDFADLVSEGNMALLRAVDKFDVSRGFKFSTYACRAILKAFSRSGVKLSRYRQLFPTDFDPKLERSDYMERKREDHEDDCVDEIRDIIRDNRAELSQIEQEVIEHRFGLSPAAVAARKAAESDAAAPPGGRSGKESARPAPSGGKKEPNALTLEQVGRIIGVTKERVRQIQNKALEKIRHTLEDEFLT